MLRKVFAVVCLLSLTACGLKGPLYMPEKKPVKEPAPMSMPSDPVIFDTQAIPETESK